MSCGPEPDAFKDDVPAGRDGVELAVESLSKAETYRVVTSLVVPRPIAWVTSVSADGLPNVAPFSYFNLVADCPPHAMFSVLGMKRTLRNILATGEFVLNVAGQELRDPLDSTAAPAGDSEEKLRRAGLTFGPSKAVGVPRLAEARAHMECVLAGVVPVGNGMVTFGRIVHIHVDGRVWDGARAAPELLDPLVRLSQCYGALVHRFTPEEPLSEHVLEDASA